MQHHRHSLRGAPRPWRSLLFGFGLIAVGLLAASPEAAAQETRVAYVNSEILLEQYPATRDAENVFKRDVEGWNREAQARKRELTRLERELEQQGPMLSDEKLRETEQTYQRKLADYDNFVQSVWGPNGLVVSRNEEILRPIIQRIQDILSQIGADQGYSVILDAADGNILYADPSLDLTQQVLDELAAQDAGTQSP